MTNILTAATLILELSRQLSRAMEEYRALVVRAKAENRDISDEELRELRRRSNEILDEWLNPPDSL